MQSKMTFFQELLEQGTKIAVKCQTDSQYSQFSNQCSWCSTQFVLNRKELISAFLEDRNKFAQIYNNCIAVGTKLRGQYGQLPCGENADNQKMLKLTLNGVDLIKFTYSENEHILEQLIPFIPQQALQEFNGRKHIVVSELKMPEGCNFIMLGRHGQTFTVFPIKKQQYLVLDSHVHFAGIMTEKNLISYTKFQNSQGKFYGYLFVTIVGGNL